MIERFPSPQNKPVVYHRVEALTVKRSVGGFTPSEIMFKFYTPYKEKRETINFLPSRWIIYTTQFWGKYFRTQFSPPSSLVISGMGDDMMFSVVFERQNPNIRSMWCHIGQARYDREGNFVGWCRNPFGEPFKYEPPSD